MFITHSIQKYGKTAYKQFLLRIETSLKYLGIYIFQTWTLEQNLTIHCRNASYDMHNLFKLSKQIEIKVANKNNMFNILVKFL